MIQSHFRIVSAEKLNENAIRLIGGDWMLITAGVPDDFNMMTASWGCLGVLWNKPVAVCFIRPQRFTLQYVKVRDYFTLSFFEEKYREVLNYCGSHSGREVDKAKALKLATVVTDKGNVAFLQARLVLECRKLYSDSLKAEHFTDRLVEQRTYPSGDHHQFFIGEIENCFEKLKP